MLVRLAIIVFLIAACLAPAAAQRTWIVDPYGGGDHVTLQAAIDAAADGDVLALRPGLVGPPGSFFTIAGKGVVIVGHPGGTCLVPTPVVVDLPGTSEVTLRNLSVRGSNGQGSLSARDCAGRLRVEDCELHADGGVSVLRCSQVSFSRVSVRSGFQSIPPHDPPTDGALRAVDSLVILDDCDVEGLAGEPGISGGSYCTDGEPGTPGLVARGTTRARVHRSRIVGGVGGPPGVGGLGCTSGPSAAAVYAGAGCEVTLRETATMGPTLGPGHVLALSTPARSLDVTTNVPSRGRVRFDASGAPGELVFGLFSLGGATIDLGPERGVYECAAVLPGGRRLLGTVDGSGHLELEVEVPALVDESVASWTIQAAFVDGTAGVRFAPACTVLVVGERARIAAAGTVVFVDAAAPPGGTGRTWDAAIDRLHEATERAWSLPTKPVQVWVRAGRYLPTWFGGSRLDYIVLLDGVELLAGFAGHETSALQRDPLTNAVLLDGDLLGDDGPGFAQRADNSRDLIVRSGGKADVAIIDGFGLRGATFGSALYATAPIRASRCRVFDNRSDNFAVVTLRPEHGTAVLESSVLRGNLGPVLDVWGGMGAPSSARVGSCVVAANDGRGAWYLVRAIGSDVVELTHLTVAQNRVDAGRAAVEVQAIHPSALVAPLLRHSILWGNVGGTASGYAEQLDLPAALVARATARNVIAAYPTPLDGTYNSALDPSFEDPVGPDGVPGTGDEDLRPRSGSPAVDSGDNGLVPAWLGIDVEGAPRRSDDPATPDTGLGTPPIVDRGAYERR